MSEEVFGLEGLENTALELGRSSADAFARAFAFPWPADETKACALIVQARGLDAFKQAECVIGRDAVVKLAEAAGTAFVDRLQEIMVQAVPGEGHA